MNLFAQTCAETDDELRRRHGKGLHHAAAIYRHVFAQGGVSFVDLPEFAHAQPLARQLTGDVRWPACRLATQQEEGGVLKFAIELADGPRIESVILPAARRSTLCVSSQAGCRRACRFCATGAMGFLRDLQPEEIVWQVYAARFLLKRPVDNVVFMGMGEPLDNFAAVCQAIRVLNDQHGLDIACRHITLSTAGHVDGLRALAATPPPRPRLAVSLHATTDALRQQLMPINRVYPLAPLREALRTFPFGPRGVVLIEYMLLAGLNDSRADARRLAQYLEGIPARVNVMACNGGGAVHFAAPDPAHLARFGGWLAEEGLFVRTRVSRGAGLRAACGQLGARPDDDNAAPSADAHATHRDGSE